MDILAYEYVYQGLKNYNDSMSKNHGNTIVKTPPTNPTYPLTVFSEIRNVANLSFNSCFERVASVGYRADIYAKTKNKITKDTIAREIAKLVDEYLSNIGLLRISFNISELVNDNSIYHIIMTYSGNLHENKRKFI
jgi:hypothetical protein